MTLLSWLSLYFSEFDVTTAAQPNIVLIFSDDAGYADFGFASNYLGRTTEFKTPNLDRLASESVFAPKGYVTSSICANSRAGMLTGIYQQRFGFHYNALATDFPNEGVPANENLIFEQMKSQGYSTGVIGKWHIGQSDVAWQPQNQGVDYFFGMWEAGSNYYNQIGTNVIRRQENLVNWGSEPSFNNIPQSSPGRHLTDAFADEATKYIADHAADANPFFLYTALNAPHGPLSQGKASDLAQFNGTSLTGERKTVASYTYGMDRAIGLILDRLDDPNGDGNTSDSIANNTIVIFTNDNGGEVNGFYDNGPLAGFKGSASEGGIRVPVLVRAPGLAPGIYDKPVSTLDFFPTFVNAGGGTLPSNLDGVDLLPYLNGTNTGTPHQYLYQHNRVNFSAIQDDQWKLVKAHALDTWHLYQLNPDGSGETVDVKDQYPEKVSELVREFVDWEVHTEKALNSTDVYVNHTDTFLFRNDLFPISGWRSSSGWINGDTGIPTTLRKDDSTSNTVLVFQTNNNADYVSRNVINRAVGVAYPLLDSGVPDLPGFAEFLLNEMRLEGSFHGTQNRKATLDGRPVMFANSRTGRPAQLGLHAADNSPTGNYLFKIDMDIVLYDDLTLTGNGNVDFEISGDISQFHRQRSLIKDGTSKVRLTGHNTFTGDISILGGSLEVGGPDGQIDNAQDLAIGLGSFFKLTGGQASFEAIINSGNITFTGGILEAKSVIGSLINDGGNFALHPESGIVHVTGDYTQNAGHLSFSIGGTIFGSDYDHLKVDGLLTLGGVLDVALTDGFVPTVGDNFWLFDSEQLGNQFTSYNLPVLPNNLLWDTTQLLSYGTLSVTTSDVLNTVGFANYFEGSLTGQAQSVVQTGPPPNTIPRNWTSAGNGVSTAMVASTVGVDSSRGVEVQRGANSDDRWAVPVGGLGFPANGHIIIEWDMKVLGTGATSGFGPFFGVDTYDDTNGPKVLGALGVDATTGDVLYQLEGTGILAETGATVSFNQWNHFRIRLDFQADTYGVFVNGQQLGTTQAFVDGVSDTFTDAALAALAASFDAASQSRTGTAYFDNFVIRDILPGDFDEDGDVDGHDFLVWQRVNSFNPLSSQNLALWKANYGTATLASSLLVVPEPTVGGLLGCLALTALARRRR
ncbi:sulfatase family protein [Bythopirellula polymerisocia]|uniref:sulfatase family protein n=1 Tax=Bythopirellula polymerisocia TaxID=2528003 RepID=UPI0018D2C5E2|nr:sulfatase-like hydrolase/transferase [Bythopirellula polymerisocia]